MHLHVSSADEGRVIIPACQCHFEHFNVIVSSSGTEELIIIFNNAILVYTHFTHWLLYVIPSNGYPWSTYDDNASPEHKKAVESFIENKRMSPEELAKDVGVSLIKLKRILDGSESGGTAYNKTVRYMKRSRD